MLVGIRSCRRDLRCVLTRQWDVHCTSSWDVNRRGRNYSIMFSGSRRCGVRDVVEVWREVQRLLPYRPRLWHLVLRLDLYFVVDQCRQLALRRREHRRQFLMLHRHQHLAGRVLLVRRFDLHFNRPDRRPSSRIRKPRMPNGRILMLLPQGNRRRRRR